MTKNILRFFCVLSLVLVGLAQALPARAELLTAAPTPPSVTPKDFISGFLVNRALTLTVQLSDGTAATDTFLLSTTWTAGKVWTVDLLSDLDVPLPGTTQKTVSIVSGQAKSIHVRFTAPTTPRLVIGDYESLNLNVSSTNSGSFFYILQAAASAPFVQAYQWGGQSTIPGWTRVKETNATQAYMQTVNFDDPKHYTTDLHSLAIAPASSPTEFNAVWDVWNMAAVPNIYSSLKSARFKLGAGAPVVHDLTTTPDINRSIFDQSPAIATAPNGVSGVAFIREDATLSNGKNRNVFLTFIDPSGNPSAAAPLNITNNPDLYNKSTPSLTPDKRYYPDFNLAISAGADNTLYVAWVEQKYFLSDSQIHRRIGLAVFSAVTRLQVASTVYLPDTSIPQELPKFVSFNKGQQTWLTYLSGGQLLGFNLSWTSSGVVLPGSPQITVGGIMVDGSNGSNFDITALSSTNLLIAWVDSTTFQPKYGIWTTAGAAVMAETSLAIPEDATAPLVIKGWIGTTTDVNGRGVITWGNTDNNKIYYSLVNTDGTVLTPPMVQLTGAGIYPGYGALSTAPLPDPLFRVNVPLLRK